MSAHANSACTGYLTGTSRATSVVETDHWAGLATTHLHRRRRACLMSRRAVRQARPPAASSRGGPRHPARLPGSSVPRHPPPGHHLRLREWVPRRYRLPFVPAPLVSWPAGRRRRSGLHPRAPTHAHLTHHLYPHPHPTAAAGTSAAPSRSHVWRRDPFLLARPPSLLSPTSTTPRPPTTTAVACLARRRFRRPNTLCGPFAHSPTVQSLIERPFYTCVFVSLVLVDACHVRRRRF